MDKVDVIHIYNGILLFIVQLLSRVWLFVTPWTVACQASLSFTISQSLLKLMSIDPVTPFNHLILCCPLLSCPQSFPASRSFPMSWLFTSGGQCIGASASVLAVNEHCRWIKSRDSGLYQDKPISCSLPWQFSNFLHVKDSITDSLGWKWPSKIPCPNFWWRRQWHPTPVLLPGKSHGRRSLVGCSPWGR